MTEQPVCSADNCETILPDDRVELVEAPIEGTGEWIETGERFAWNQVYRAAEALEDATNGAIEFKKHRRFGWILVGDPQVVKNLSRASSVGER